MEREEHLAPRGHEGAVRIGEGRPIRLLHPEVLLDPLQVEPREVLPEGLPVGDDFSPRRTQGVSQEGSCFQGSGPAERAHGGALPCDVSFRADGRVEDGDQAFQSAEAPGLASDAFLTLCKQ